MAEYLACQNATQRARVMRAAKFPKKIEVAAYTQIRKPLRDALSKPGFAHGDLEFLTAKLEAKAGRESGYNRDEAMRCARAALSSCTHFLRIEAASRTAFLLPQA